MGMEAPLVGLEGEGSLGQGGKEKQQRDMGGQAGEKQRHESAEQEKER